MDTAKILNIIMAVMIIVLVILWFYSIHTRQKKIYNLEIDNDRLKYDLDFEKKWRLKEKETHKEWIKTDHSNNQYLVEQLEQLNSDIEAEVSRRVKVYLFKWNKAKRYAK